jgi:hypothetical protein
MTKIEELTIGELTNIRGGDAGAWENNSRTTALPGGGFSTDNASFRASPQTFPHQQYQTDFDHGLGSPGRHR